METDDNREASIGVQVVDRLATDPRNKYEELDWYMRDMGRYPLLSDEQFNELHDGWKRLGDRKAFDLMVYCNSRLILSIALKNRSYQLRLLDKLQEGFFGIRRAIEKFDPQRGLRFSTYATHWIRQAISRACADLDETRPFRIPVHMQEKVAIVAREANSFYANHGRHPNQQEAFKWIHRNDESEQCPQGMRNFTWEEFVAADEIFAQNYYSMHFRGDHPDGGKKLSFGDTLADGGVDGEVAIEARRLVAEYEAAFDRLERAATELLSPREAMILRLRFGLGEFEKMTLEEVGERYELTRERIRQIEVRAFEKISEALGVTGEQIGEMAAALEELKKLTGAETSEPNGSSIKTPATPAVPALEVLFGLLCEHILLTARKERVVKAPLQVLKVRLSIPFETGRTVLEQLRQSNLIEGDTPWDIVRVIPEVALPAFNNVDEDEAELGGEEEIATEAAPASGLPTLPVLPHGAVQSVDRDAPIAAIGLGKLTDLFARYGVTSVRHLTERTKMEIVSMGIVRRRLGFVRERLGTYGLSLKEDAVQFPAVGNSDRPRRRLQNRILERLTYTQVHRVLASRASTVSGERVVRGVVPLLCAEFGIWQQDAVQILERFRAEAYLVPCDGWRAITLSSESVNRDERLFPSTILASVSKLQLVKGGAKESPVSNRRPSAKHAVLDTAIAWLERQLPQLENLVGNAQERLAKLKATIATLKVARDCHEVSAEAVNEAIAGAEAATTEFFALLRESGGTE